VSLVHHSKKAVGFAIAPKPKIPGLYAARAYKVAEEYFDQKTDKVSGKLVQIDTD
jgi:hypothetical protein